MKFGARSHNRTHTKVRWCKCPISKIQHGGRPPFWKSLYLHISAANRPNFTKFSVQTQILSQATETWQKFRNSQFQNGGWTPHWKSLLGYNSATHIVPLRWNLEWGRIARIRSRSDDRMPIPKIQNSERQHFENGHISVSEPRIVHILQNTVHKRKFW